jgi:diguanylate cyclase
MFNVENWQVTLQQLSQAIYNYEQWHKELTRIIICRLPYGRRDLAEDAHRQCRFGQWYYGDVPQALRDHPGFVALEVEHESMHRFAAQLLRTLANELSVSPSDYDNFANALDRFHRGIYTLKHEIEDSLHSRDALTGTEGRMGMLTKLREAFEMAKRHAEQCCIAMMDLDHFKTINDTYGHLLGDQVLAASACYVMEHVRLYDKVFRYGGEEFLIMMPGTGLQASQVVIERICSGLAATVLARDGDKPIFITAAFGITLLDPDVRIEQSIDRADKAMFDAKTAGRNRVCVWDPLISSEGMFPVRSQLDSISQP